MTGPLTGPSAPTPRQAERIGILTMFKLLARVSDRQLGGGERRAARQITTDAAAAGPLRIALQGIEVI